jgi:hypothetical protein
MRDRAIGVADLNQLRLWIDSQPEVPEGDWYKDFGSFKICGRGSYPKTFLRARPPRDMLFDLTASGFGKSPAKSPGMDAMDDSITVESDIFEHKAVNSNVLYTA